MPLVTQSRIKERTRAIRYLFVGLVFCFAFVLIACQSLLGAAPSPLIDTVTEKQQEEEQTQVLPIKTQRLIVDQSVKRKQEVYNWPALGFDSVSEELKPSCLDKVLLSSSVGQKKIDFKFSMAESREELAKHLNVDGHVGFNWGFLSGSGSVDYVNGHSAENYSLYLIMKATLNTQTVSVIDADLSADAHHALKDKSYEELIEKCGDQFVSSVTLGGSYYAVFRIVASSYDQHQEFKAAIRIRILFAHITVHIHKVLSDIHRHAKEMSFHVMQSPELIPRLKSGDFSLVDNAATFITEAESYLKQLESYCQVSVEGGEHVYPSECVSEVSLQDYLTLSPLLVLDDAKTLQLNATLIKGQIKQLLNLASHVEHDLFFVLRQPYLFQVSNDPNQLRQFSGDYDLAKLMQSNLFADLDYCVASLLRTEQGRCSKYLTVTTGGHVSELLGQLERLQASIPVRQDNPFLPQTCQEVAEYGVLATYVETTLYYQRNATKPFTVVCIPSLQSSLIYEEYLNVVQEDDYVYNIIAQSGANTLDTSTNIASANHGGAAQVTRWTRYRIDPISMRIDLDESRFKTVVGFAQENDFGLDYKEGMPVASLYACSKDQPEDPLTLFSILNLAGTDLLIDPLSLEPALWETRYEQASQPAFLPSNKLMLHLDESEQRLALWTSLERNECLSTVAKEIRLIPRSAVVGVAPL